MKQVRTVLTIAALVIGVQASQAQQTQSPPVDSLALARLYTQWFYTGMADSLIAHYDPADSAGRRSPEEILQVLDQLTTRAGNEVSVIEEKFVKRNGKTQYWRTAKFDSFDEPILLRWVILPGGYIGGMGLGPLSQAPPIDPN